MTRSMFSLFAVPALLLSTGFANSQYDQRDQRQYNQGQYNQRQYNQGQYDQDQYTQRRYDHHHNDRFYNGVRDGGSGGYYQQDNRYDNGQVNNGYSSGYYDNHGDPRTYDEQHRGGIGPGKGALIGGAGGAVLGAIFGGGLKGSLIGGAAGAGVGAIVGKAHQNNTRRNDGYYQR